MTGEKTLIPTLKKGRQAVMMIQYARSVRTLGVVAECIYIVQAPVSKGFTA